MVARTQEIFFTSGATESNNMAVKGVANFYEGKKTAMQCACANVTALSLLARCRSRTHSPCECAMMMGPLMKT